MPFRVSGKNIDVGEALRERIGARIASALEKYFDGGYSGHATIGKEAFGFHTEFVLHLDSGIVFSADSMAADPYLSADQAADSLEKQLRRYHRKLKDYRVNGRGNSRLPGDGLAADATASVLEEQPRDDEKAKAGPAVVAESAAALKQFSVSDAVAELDVTGAAVMVFRHAGHGRVNIIYRRADGNIGWVDPPAEAH